MSVSYEHLHCSSGLLFNKYNLYIPVGLISFFVLLLCANVDFTVLGGSFILIWWYFLLMSTTSHKTLQLIMYWHLASIPIVLQRVVLKCSVKQHFALWKITIYNCAFSRQLSQQKHKSLDLQYSTFLTCFLPLNTWSRGSIVSKERCQTLGQLGETKVAPLVTRCYQVSYVDLHIFPWNIYRHYSFRQTCML